MATDRWIRVSDEDRQGAVELLSEAYAVGRLSREELDERVTAAYSARTCGELRDLSADLPLPPARTGLPSDIVASRRVPRRAGRLVGQLIWIFFCARAGGRSGRAGEPRSRVVGRDADTHRAAAADIGERHQQVAKHPRGNAIGPPRSGKRRPAAAVLEHDSRNSAQANQFAGRQGRTDVDTSLVRRGSLSYLAQRCHVGGPPRRAAAPLDRA
jgi:hypothetical protein